MKNNPPEVFICECNSTEHQMIFLYGSDEDFPMVYAQVHLNKKPILKRLKYAVQYLLGRKSRFGAFDEFIFNPDDAERLQEVVNYLKQSNEV
jgi:hypothetical protein